MMLRSTMTCVLLVVGAACAAGRADAQAERRCPRGETQVDLNRCAEDDFQVADAALDRAYREALRRLDPASVNRCAGCSGHGSATATSSATS